MSDLYVSLDIEADGPCPGINSMLQLGAASFNEHGGHLSSFQRNLTLLPGAVPDPKTMNWWGTNRTAYALTRVSVRNPFEVMQEFKLWLERDGYSFSKITAICYPAGFDFTWVYWYCCKFLGECPVGFQCLDIKTFAAAKLGVPYRKASKRHMPKEWFKGLPPHTHGAADDALEQGLLFFRIRDSK